MLHALLINTEADKISALFSFRADMGHWVTQRIQEMHFRLSVSIGFEWLMAWAGHFLAQEPHNVQLCVALGTSLGMTVFLYGWFPGRVGEIKRPSVEFSFSMICLA